MSNWLLRLASLYFAIGVSLGVYMGIARDFTEVPVHAHINLLGWVSLGLVGLLYGLRPEFAATRLARAHFVLHNLGLPIMTGALFFLLRGNESAGPLVEVGASLVVVGVFCLALNVWRMTQPAAFSRRQPATAAG